MVLEQNSCKKLQLSKQNNPTPQSIIVILSMIIDTLLKIIEILSWKFAICQIFPLPDFFYKKKNKKEQPKLIL